MKAARKRRDEFRPKREPAKNSDIRPWISVGEAAELALSKIIKTMQDARGEK